MKYRNENNIEFDSNFDSKSMKNNNVKDWFKGKRFYISLVAGAVFFGDNAEILNNANWQDVQKNR